MSRFDAQRAKVAGSVQRELATPNVISREQARLYSQAVRLEWKAGALPTWRPEEADRQLSDAERLIEAARVLRGLGRVDESSAAYRRAGDLLEWLSRAGGSADHPNLQPVPLALLAAAAFQLAGYPAMAKGLLGEKRLPAAEKNMFAAFLRADFDGVLRHCLDYWRERPGMTGPDGIWTRKPPLGGEPSAELISSELVRCLGLISQSLRIDDQARLKLGLRKLLGLSRLAVRAVSGEVWLTLALTAEVAELYAKASLWVGIGRLRGDIADEGQESLNIYVRNQFRAGRGLLWPSQQEGIRRLSSGASFAMCTPTGSGKTTIAELAIVRTLYRKAGPDRNGPVPGVPGEAPLVLYLVPSRALAAEVEARLSFDIGLIDQRVTITGIYGGTDWSLTDRWLTAKGPTVLICTVEMAETLLRYVGPLLIGRLELVIVDEAHQVQFDETPNSYESLRKAENRAARLEQFAARLFTHAPDCPAVALSAVAGGAEQAIARWVSRDFTSVPHGQNYRSTRQLIGRLDCSASGTSVIRLELVDGKPLYLSGRSTEAYIPTPFAPMPRTTGRLRTDLVGFVRCQSLWAAIQLARSGRTVLISVTQSIDDVIGDFCDAIDLAAWRAEGIVAFSRPEEGATRHGIDVARLYTDCLNACNEYCGPASYESRLLKMGVAVHHGQLPIRVRRLMTEVIRLSVVPITVATSTLTEGVNMPFDVILLPSTVRRQRKGSDRFENVMISTPEFLNLAGRAGRPGAGVEGITLIALATEPTSQPGSGAYKKQRTRISRDEANFNHLVRRIGAPDLSAGRASSPLWHLLTSLWGSWQRLRPGADRREFLRWLEEADPASIPPAGEGWAELADMLDSLDLVLVSAIAEAERLKDAALEGPDLEGYIRVLWSHTYARFSVKETDWLERIFVTRGVGARENVYRDAEERRLIYRLGLPPRRSASFLGLAAKIEAELRAASEFAGWSREDRFAYFVRVGNLLRDDLSFRIRDARNHQKKAGASWPDILRWWMRAPGAVPPDASVVRDWLFVATSDFEFRLGAAINSTISNLWSSIHGDISTVPTLEDWRKVTGLPWAAFWLRELLSWGTLEPVVAYLMGAGGSTGVTTREQAEKYIDDYYNWYLDRNPDAGSRDDFFNPLRLAEWHRASFDHLSRKGKAKPEEYEAYPNREFPADSPETYPVLPCELADRIVWMDAAGYRLAESGKPPAWREKSITERDYLLDIKNNYVYLHWYM
jgi:hypothetical protein